MPTPPHPDPLDSLGTKVRAPRLPAGLVVRARLLARVAGSDARIVLVSAPAGFGKTVLVRQWLVREGVPHAWLSLDALDADPRRFLHHLAAAFGTLEDAGAGRVAALLAQSASLPPEAVVSAAVAEALGEIDPRAAIVLDDLHEIESGPVHRVVQALLERGAAGPRVVLVTRVDPPLALGRWRVAGEVLEVREGDLRFDDAEVEEFFRDRRGGEDAELRRRLTERTEGWAAGLRMAALAMERADDPRAVVDSFTGRHRFVTEYLLEEAVGRQREPVQRFLLETAVLDRFTAEACAAVTGDAGAGTLLHEVEEANLFVVALGDDRRWFRYHHLFAELLRFRLQRLHPERFDPLHERASRWFEAEGDLHAALEHAARMTDRSRLAALLDQHAMELLGRSETANLTRWMRRIPDPERQPFPGFLVAVAWMRILTERTPALEPLLSAIGAALERVPAGYGAARARTARVQMHLLQAFAARFAGDLDRALSIGLRVLEELPPDAAQPRGVLLYNQARVHMMLGETAPAGACLARASEENLRAGNLYLALTGQALAGEVLLQTEGFEAARAALDAAVGTVEARGLERLPVFANLLFARVNVELVADRMGEAERWLRRALEVAAGDQLPEARANGLVATARVRAAQGRFDEAEALLAELVALARTHNALLLDTTPELERTRLALLRDSAGQYTPPPAEERGEAEEGRWTVIREAGALLALRSALRDGRDDEARALAARVAAEAEGGGRGIALCVARLAAAVLDRSESRWAMLDDALGLAASRGYVRPLREMGEPLRALLRAGLGRSLAPSARAHARLLLDGSGDGASLPSRHRGAPEPTESLTEREREVLDHLLRGLSNKAIARAMFVSAETVKTHLKHLYAKLGVGTRRQAADRARELGLGDDPAT